MIKYIIRVLLSALLLITFAKAEAQRFPKPEFENGYTQPETQKPAPRSNTIEWIDIAVLISSLAVVSWLVIRKRSRRGVFLMSLFSLAYFGFFREGCICSVGSVQNISLALFHPENVIPISAILFFVLPIVFTLLFGRTFCAGVCPLGAIQDLVAIKPMALPRWLQKSLGIIPVVYLGLGVLYAATASDFIICRYDPFVGIFRLSASFSMYLLGGAILLAGVFIARPYCRFLCPYGVILNWVSRFSVKHLSITPAECIQCKLCEPSCPYGAIEKPTGGTPAKWDTREIVFRFTGYMVLVPGLILLGIWGGGRLSDGLSVVNPKVKLEMQVSAEQNIAEKEQSSDVRFFRESGTSLETLRNEVAEIRSQFSIASRWLGAFIGLAIGLWLVSLTLVRFRDIYEPHRGECISCARCVDFCPVKPGSVTKKTNE